ncbi:MAG: hypothetical protein J0H88_01605 [Sphingomonadales bacterium]|nr:hypothetical protein [Sphingomonadales bacterium]
MPEWLVKTLFVIAILAILFVIGTIQIRRMHARTLMRRPNPDRAEFIAMLSGDMRPETAGFLWEKAVFYIAPKLTPHPDDHLHDDLAIDDDDPVMDWLPEFADSHGRDWKKWPDWPEDWDSSIRNFGRWLEMGLGIEGATP